MINFKQLTPQTAGQFHPIENLAAFLSGRLTIFKNSLRKRGSISSIIEQNDSNLQGLVNLYIYQITLKPQKNDKINF